MNADNRGKHFLLWLLRGHQVSQEMDTIVLLDSSDNETDQKSINWKMRDSGVSNQYLRNSNEIKFLVDGGKVYEKVKLFSFDQPTANYVILDLESPLNIANDGEITIPIDEIDLFVKDVGEL